LLGDDASHHMLQYLYSIISLYVWVGPPLVFAKDESKNSNSCLNIV